MIRFKIIFAFLYDLLLLLAIWFVAAIPFILWQGEGFDKKPLTLLAFQIYLIGVTYLYLTHFWTQSGQTPGLKTWDLQIVREDGYILNRYNANMRFVLTTLLCLVGWIGLFTAKKQLLQDSLGKTKIIAVKTND